MNLMKNTKKPILAVLLGAISAAPAANIMINLHTDGTGAVSGPENLTLSPGHRTGLIGTDETSWNNFDSTGPFSSLVYSDGTPADGVSVTFGSESSTTAGLIDYSTTATINVVAVDGTDSNTAGNIRLTGSADSIYGNGTTASNTAPARAGWLGNASGPNDGLGLRIDGLAAGSYTVMILGRNTNSSATRATDFFGGTGVEAGTFDYSGLTAFTAANSAVPDTNPTGYDTFIAGENYATFNLSLADGDSLFLAADGNPAGTELRGFINMVQIVSVPEPSVSLLGLASGLMLLRRSRRS